MHCLNSPFKFALFRVKLIMVNALLFDNQHVNFLVHYDACGFVFEGSILLKLVLSSTFSFILTALQFFLPVGKFNFMSDNTIN